MGTVYPHACSQVGGHSCYTWQGEAALAPTVPRLQATESPDPRDPMLLICWYVRPLMTIRAWKSMLLFRVQLGTIPWDVPSILYQAPGGSSAQAALATLAFWSNGRGSYVCWTFSETSLRAIIRPLGP